MARISNKKQAEVKSSIVDSTMNVVRELNGFSLQTAEILLDKSLERTQEWQAVSEKAIAEGLKLSKKQTDLVFKTLESFKGQFKKGKQRTLAFVK